MEFGKIILTKDEYDEMKRCEEAYYKLVDFLEENMELDCSNKERISIIFHEKTVVLKYIMVDGDYNAIVEKLKNKDVSTK